MDYGYTSIIGKTREKDEDSLLILSALSSSNQASEERILAVVADGMGGGESGEIASKIAVDAFKSSLGPLILRDKYRSMEIRDMMKESFVRANSDILQYARVQNFYLMGTTATTVFLSGDHLVVGNIGDSRTYIFDSNGHTKFRTRDHTYVQGLVDSKEISAEDARSDPRRNELTRALGIEAVASPDYYRIKIRSGDSILLCCDGLWEAYSDEEIGMSVASQAPAQEIANSLTASANEKDGSDNISMILIRT